MVSHYTVMHPKGKKHTHATPYIRVQKWLHRPARPYDFNLAILPTRDEFGLSVHRFGFPMVENGTIVLFRVLIGL